MLGIMVLTTFDMLSEHNLLKADSPDAEIKNVGLMSMLMLEFLHVASDLDLQWGREVVRLLDNAGIDTKTMLRKQVFLDEKDIDDYRQDVNVTFSDGRPATRKNAKRTRTRSMPRWRTGHPRMI